MFNRIVSLQFTKIAYLSLKTAFLPRYFKVVIELLILIKYAKIALLLCVLAVFEKTFSIFDAHPQSLASSHRQGHFHGY